MTEQELMAEALKWQEHIAKLASDYSDQELYLKRAKTLDWLIERAKQAEEMEKELEILGEVISSAENADELNDEYLRLKGLEGEEIDA